MKSFSNTRSIKSAVPVLVRKKRNMLTSRPVCNPLWYTKKLEFSRSKFHGLRPYLQSFGQEDANWLASLTVINPDASSSNASTKG